MNDSIPEDLIIIKASFPTDDKPIMDEEASVKELMDYLQGFNVIIKRDLIDENIPIIVNNLEKQRSTPAAAPAAEEDEEAEVEGGDDDGVEGEGDDDEVEEEGDDLKTALKLIEKVLMEYNKTKDKVINITNALDKLHGKIIDGGNFELGVSEDDEQKYVDKNVFIAINGRNSNPVVSVRDSDSGSDIEIKITKYEGNKVENIARYFYKEKKGKLEEYLHFIYYFVNIMNHLLPEPEARAPAPEDASGQEDDAAGPGAPEREPAPQQQEQTPAAEAPAPKF